MLDAAERVIGRLGFHDAGMIEIAREAEHAIGTLYSLFPSKEALFEQLLIARAEELRARMAEALACPGTLRDRFEAVLEAKLAFFARHLAFARIYASTVLASGWGLPQDVVRLREAAIRDVVRAAREAASRGEVRADARPEDLAIAFRAVTQAFLLRAAQDPAGFREDDVRRAVRAVFLEPLLAPPRVRRPRS